MNASGLAIVAWALAADVTVAAPTATRTPVPARLSGGFGRAATTPVASGSGGQSLSDVVRAASQAREVKETPRPGVAITNQSLVKDPNRGRLTTWPSAPRPAGHAVPPPAAPTPEKNAAASPTPTAAAPEANSEEARWQEIARRSRQRVENAKDQVSRLDAETKKLESDFYSWDDGQYRDNVIKPAWDKKREELETARRELEEAERDLVELPEKARKAGALPGWIRE